VRPRRMLALDGLEVERNLKVYFFHLKKLPPGGIRSQDP
jgi:hypothetical protein